MTWFKNIILGLLMVVLVATVSACSKSKEVADWDSAVEEQETPSLKQLETGDILSVLVKGEKQCTGEFLIDAQGDIDFCYVGKLSVVGKDLEEIEPFIKEVLAKDYLQNPHVRVSVNTGLIDEATVGNIRILGEVNSPGVYQMKKGYTVLDAVLDAGGFTDFASPNKTRIVRGQGRGKKIIVVKMKEMMKTGDRAGDQTLQPGDIIVVPEGIL